MTNIEELKSQLEQIQRQIEELEGKKEQQPKVGDFVVAWRSGMEKDAIYARLDSIDEDDPTCQYHFNSAGWFENARLATDVLRWIEWGGGEQPVHTLVLVQLRDGTYRIDTANCFDWRHDKDNDSDIVRYIPL